MINLVILTGDSEQISMHTVILLAGQFLYRLFKAFAQGVTPV